LTSRVLAMIERRAEDQSADIILKYVLRRGGVKHTARGAACRHVEVEKFPYSGTSLSGRSKVLAGF